MLLAENNLIALLFGVRPDERRRLILASLFFFCVLASYYLLRPMRDAMGLAGGVDNLPWMFMGTLTATLLVSPLFSSAVARWPRRTFAAWSYRTLIGCLGIFYLLWTGAPESWQIWIGRAFFIWISVYVVFGVSLMWSLMADCFRHDQAKRLFPLIGAGGTLGGLAGSALAATLSTQLGVAALMLIAALLLEAAVRAMNAMSLRATAEEPGQAALDAQPVGGGALDGLLGLGRSPYLLGIAGFMLLFTMGSTVLYLLQAAIVADAVSGLLERQTLFAQIDFAVNAITLIGQLLLTRHMIARIGVRWTLGLLPLLSIAGFLCLAVAPTLAVVVVFQVIRRAGNFAIAGPTRELLYIPLNRQEKYKVKNVIDTFVFRAGDQIGASTQALLTTLGAGLSALAVMAVPLSALWLALALWLGSRHRRLTAPVRQPERRRSGGGRRPALP